MDRELLSEGKYESVEPAFVPFLGFVSSDVSFQNPTTDFVRSNESATVTHFC